MCVYLLPSAMSIIRKDVTLSWDPHKCMCPCAYASPTQLSLCCPLKLNFGANMRLDLWGSWLFLLSKGIPIRCLRSCHKTMGFTPLWVGMKGQMMPILVFVCGRTHSTLAYLFAFTLCFFKRTFVSWVICISIAQSRPPVVASNDVLTLSLPPCMCWATHLLT